MVLFIRGCYSAQVVVLAAERARLEEKIGDLQEDKQGLEESLAAAREVEDGAEGAPLALEEGGGTEMENILERK